MTSLHQSLAGIRVVSVEQAVAAPLASRHLSELGAEVIKIEPFEGDFARRFDGFVKGFASHFVWLNHGKQSLPLDLRNEEDLRKVTELVEDADVLISNLAPGKAESLLPIEELRRTNPGLIRCTISGYGPSGSYRLKKAYDSLIQGEAGVTLNTGLPGSPAKSAISIADVGAGAYAFASISAAMFKRERTGQGSDIHISLFDVLAEWMMPLSLAEKYAGEVPPPSGVNHASIVPYGAYEAEDGALVNIAVQTNRHWARFAEHVLLNPELAQTEKFKTNTSRFEHREQLEAILKSEISRVDSGVLTARLEEWDIPYGRMNDVNGLIAHPQIVERNRWYEIQLPDGGSAETLLPPFLAEAPNELRQVPGLAKEGNHEA